MPRKCSAQHYPNKCNLPLLHLTTGARTIANSPQLPTLLAVLISSPHSSSQVARVGQSVLSTQSGRCCRRGGLLKEQLLGGNGVHVHRRLTSIPVQTSPECSFPCPGPRGEEGKWVATRERVFSLGQDSRLLEEGLVDNVGGT